MSKTCLVSKNAAPAVGPYSHAVKANGFIFLSGQCPFAADGSGPVRGTIEEQTRLALDNVKAILDEVGNGLESVVKSTVFLADMNDFQAVNAVYAEYFPENPPARSCYQVAKLPFDVSVEVEVVAVA